MSRDSISRRRLLRGLAGAVAATPLLSGLCHRVVHAQGGQGTKRFFLMFTGNGQDPSHWLPPSGGAKDFTLSPVLEPLASHRDKLLLVHGLHGEKGHSGGMSETTTGWPATDGSGIPPQGPSIDQLVAEAWRYDAPLGSLELGVMPANAGNDQTSYSSSGLPLPAIGSPLGAFHPPRLELPPAFRSPMSRTEHRPV